MHLHLDVPDMLADRDSQELADLAREALIVRLYALGELSSGEGAELLSIPRRELLNLLEQYNVSILDDSIDVRREASHD